MHFIVISASLTLPLDVCPVCKPVNILIIIALHMLTLAHQNKI